MTNLTEEIKALAEALERIVREAEIDGLPKKALARVPALLDDVEPTLLAAIAKMAASTRCIFLPSAAFFLLTTATD